MNPKRQRILLLIMLVVLAAVVANRQFFRHDRYDERNAAREERLEGREAQQRERDARRDADLKERNARRDANLNERDARRDAGLNERNAKRDAGFDRSIKQVAYSKHARCRMDCRQIDESEINEIKNKGRVNLAKSELRSKPDPKYALEGITRDKQHVRIVFAQKDGSLVVVTVIDLDTDWTCHCK